MVAVAGVRGGRSRYGLGNRLTRPGSAGLSRLSGNPGSASLVLRETAALTPIEVALTIRPYRAGL